MTEYMICVMNAKGRQKKIDEVFKSKGKDEIYQIARIAIGSIWEN